jgi:TRAP-type C4-dicarboxylate transport system permease small subunit
MDRTLHALSRVLEFLIAAALAVMVVLVFGNVVMRYAFNSGITVSEEVSRWLFIWSTFLGALVALRERAHLGVDMLVSRLPAWGKKVCMVTTHVLMIVILGMLFKGALDQTRINWDVTAPTTGWSMAVVHASAVVFAAIAALILCNDLLRFLSGRMQDDELVMVQESEEAAQLDAVLGKAATAEAAR